ncbi:MAG: ABC transporter permease [Acidobacteria bacterium]|nr:ABC transporter permease [Acidobacteriota bacterium]
MSLWTRIVNAFGGDRLNREIDEEMRLHIEEAVASGRSEEEARRAFGNLLLTRERSRDARVMGWLEGLVSDVRFGVRQIRKHKAVSASAALSLALAVGSSTAAFRLIDAMLLRPLPVKNPESLHYLAYTFPDQAGKPQEGDSFSYPLFLQLGETVKGDAELLAISYAYPVDLTFGSDAEMERAPRQYVSGNVFPTFGLRPALGRLLGPDDNLKPGAHPVAVLSYDYWSSRFGRDPGVLGRKFRIGEQVYEVVGVGPEGFTGTETGVITGVFVPTMMNQRAIGSVNWSWFRTWVRPRPGQALEPLRERLQTAFTNHRREMIKGFESNLPRQSADAWVRSKLTFQPASAGASRAQREYARALAVLGALVTLVLLIACANVANLMMAQTAGRAREMALRVSIGAGKWRLIQLVLVESAMLAATATLLGGAFAWWAAPWVMSRVNPPDQPLQLVLPADWRVLGFAAALSVVVTLLFGLAPALRASHVQPAYALKGGDGGRSRLRLIHVLAAGQVAFCFVVHFSAGLFVDTFQRITHQPLGFNPQRLALVEVSVKNGKQVTGEAWRQVADTLRTTPGVESAAMCSWPLMSGNAWTGTIRMPGKGPEAVEAFYLAVDPGFIPTMGIALKQGRNLNEADKAEGGGAAVVSEAFVRRYFGGGRAVGRTFERLSREHAVRYEVVGVVADVRYRSLRDPLQPVVFVPGDASGTFAVRTAGADPLAMAPALRTAISQARPDFRVSNTYTQQMLVDKWSIRERLLATLSVFFAAVAMALAGIGLYGVLNYSVQMRTRELGIRMALGASARHVGARVMARIGVVFAVGAAAGLAGGLSSERAIGTLLYAAHVSDPGALAVPLAVVGATALIASIPPLLRAIRIDPARTLRAE